jgi:hypothetical protein
MSAINPTLQLNFAKTKRLDPRITFSRADTGASQATYFGADGLLKYAGIGEPRFDHDPATGESLGLLIEEQRQNLLSYSQEFDNAYWVKTNVVITSNAVTAPDGTLSGDKLVTDNAILFSNSLVRTGFISKAASATTYTATIFAKAGEFNRILLQVRDSASGANAAAIQFNLVDGSIAVAASASGTFTNASSVAAYNVENGWYRCSLTFTSGTETNLLFQISARDSVATTGDGTSGIYIWGAQLEAGSFPTSYIPTTSAAVTRNPDIASMTGTNFTSWYNQSEGSFVLSAKPHSGLIASDPLARVYYGVGDSTLSFANAETMYIARNASNASLALTVLDAAAYQTSGTSFSTTQGAAFNHAFGYQTNNFATSLNGLPALTDGLGTVPTVTSLAIGGSGGLWTGVGGNYINGHISRLTYWPKRLPDATLQALSK